MPAGSGHPRIWVEILEAARKEGCDSNSGALQEFFFCGGPLQPTNLSSFQLVAVPKASGTEALVE